MKLSILFIGIAFADEVAEDDACRQDGKPCGRIRGGGKGGFVEGSEEELAARRFNDLKDMFGKMWHKNGYKGKDKFEESKYWNYGCHCSFLGENVFGGKGRPKDALDQRCKAFKNCVKCVGEKHGAECNHNQRKYSWKWSSRKNTLLTMNKKGSCQQELFQCDKQFVYDVFAVRELFDNSFHPIKSAEEGKTFDPNEPEHCPSGTPASPFGADHQCCGGLDKSYKWINLNKFQCCRDGTTMSIDHNCPGY